MAENSKIEWTDHTVNFWWGCTKVSPACANCYAESLDARFNPFKFLDAGTGDGDCEVVATPHWGPAAPRLLRVTQARNEALRYERQAVKEGRRFRVFTNSMSDFFEDRRDLDLPRLEALDTIRETPHLDWLILTKRPEKIIELLWIAANRAHTLIYPPRGRDLHDWIHSWISAGIDGQVPPNVWLGTTVESQEWADKRIPALLRAPAAVRFLSCEPLLGPVDLTSVEANGELDALRGTFDDGGLDTPIIQGCPRLDWVIAGGESGPHARPMHPDWARGLRDQCAAARVPFMFKQWGEWAPIDQPWTQNDPAKLAHNEQWWNRAGGQGFHGEEVWRMRKVGKHASGRLLDGAEHNEFPEVHHA